MNHDNYLVQPVIATEEGIRSAIDQYYSKRTAEKAVEDLQRIQSCRRTNR